MDNPLTLHLLLFDEARIVRCYYLKIIFSIVSHSNFIFPYLHLCWFSFYQFWGNFKEKRDRLKIRKSNKNDDLISDNWIYNKIMKQQHYWQWWDLFHGAISRWHIADEMRFMNYSISSLVMSADYTQIKWCKSMKKHFPLRSIIFTRWSPISFSPERKCRVVKI